ncbi:MAG: universal stress protein [Pseudomonadota bacterium]
MKKIVIAVDGSIHSKNAVHYAAEKYKQLSDVSFSLIHIQPTVSQYLAEEAGKTTSGKGKLEKIHLKNQSVALELLAELKDTMIREGVDEKDIECFTQPRRHNAAKDILDYSEKKNVCAVLAGRSGISYMKELMIGSVTSELFTHSKLVPIWVVDHKVRSGDLLVAVDGSPGSRRVVDHVSFVMAGAKFDRIIFLHIASKLSDYCPVDSSKKNEEMEDFIKKSDRSATADFHHQALAMLKKAGIAEQRIDFKTLESRWLVGKAIIEEAKRLNTQTIVVGKSGSGDAEHIGKVPRYIINKFEDCAIWLVP